MMEVAHACFGPVCPRDFIDPATLVGAAFYAFLFILVAWFLARLVRVGVRRVAYLLNDQAACTP